MKNKEEDITVTVTKSRSNRREEKAKTNKIWTIILYVISVLHLGLLVFYIVDTKQFIGLNFIFPVPDASVPFHQFPEP